MIKSRTILVLAMIFAILTALCACGNADTAGQTTPPSDPAKEATTEPTAEPFQPAASPDENFIFELSSDSEYYTIKAANAEISGDIVIPNEHNLLPVKYIDACGFQNCTGITGVTIMSDVMIGGNAFYGCEALSSVTIFDGVWIIDQYAFYRCTALLSIKVPSSVKNIDSCALRGCTNLSEIIYDGTMEEWNKVVKIESWDSYTGQYTVCCTDGNIPKKTFADTLGSIYQKIHGGKSKCMYLL